MNRSGRLLAILIALWPVAASAQTAPPPGVLGLSLRRAANGALGILAYNSIPDTSASSLAIDRGDQGDPGLDIVQFGVGFTMSDSFPLYLEGFLQLVDDPDDEKDDRAERHDDHGAFEERAADFPHVVRFPRIG